MKLSERIRGTGYHGLADKVAQLEADVVKLENEVIRLEDENDALSQLMNAINDELLVSEKKVDQYMNIDVTLVEVGENEALVFLEADEWVVGIPLTLADPKVTIDIDALKEGASEQT